MIEEIKDEQIPGKMRRAYKAQVARMLIARQRDFFSKMSPSEKEDFLYKVYVKLDKCRDPKKEVPIFRPGLPKIVASKKVYRLIELGILSGFDIPMFKLLERIAKAWDDVKGETIVAQMEKEIDGD